MTGVYKARTAYQDNAVVEEYEARRFSGRFGRYVWRREQAAVGALLESIGSLDSVLDCPSGFGRWLPQIERLDPEVVLEVDVSAQMLLQGRRTYNPRWPMVRALAEALPFADDAVDLVFCHALTKHLPQGSQEAVLAEFARVSRRYVLCSFSVRAGVPALVLKGRERVGTKSNAVTSDWLEKTARRHGLRILQQRACTSHVGTERAVLFVKHNAAQGPEVSG